MDRLNQKSDNMAFLSQFVWEDMSGLMILLDSIQTGNFSDRNIAMKMITPLFFSMDRVNYKRWSCQDLLMKKCKYPADLIKLYENEGSFDKHKSF